MAKIIDYQLVSARGTATLSQSVKNLLADGWQPWGSPTCEDPHDAEIPPLCAQAVVRFEDEE